MLILRGQRTEVRCLAFSPSGDLLASGGVNKSVRLWDRQTGRTRFVFRDHPGIIHALAFAPDGQTLAIGNRHLFVRHLETGVVGLGSVAEFHFAGDVCFSPDGRTVISISQALTGPNRILYGIVTAWDVSGSPNWVQEVAVGRRQEKWYPAVPPQNDVSGPLQKALGLLYPVWAAAFAPDGQDLALGTENVGVLLWDLTLRRFRTALATGAPIRAVAFSPDGQLVAGAADAQVQVWDRQSGTPIATLRGHRNRVTSLAFAPGAAGRAGATLLSGSEDGTVRLWEATTGRERTAFCWPTGKVRAVAFAPDGMTAAAAGYTGQVIVWDIDDG